MWRSSLCYCYFIIVIFNASADRRYRIVLACYDSALIESCPQLKNSGSAITPLLCVTNQPFIIWKWFSLTLKSFTPMQYGQCRIYVRSATSNTPLEFERCDIQKVHEYPLKIGNSTLDLQVATDGRIDGNWKNTTSLLHPSVCMLCLWLI